MAFTLCDSCKWADTCMEAEYGLDVCPVYEPDDQTAEDDDEPSDVCDLCGAHVCRIPAGC